MGNNEFVKIRLEFETKEWAYMLDVSSLLYDFELLHDFLVLSSIEDYSKYRFTQYFWYRDGRPLEDVDRLRVVRIVKHSPLVVEIIVGLYAACVILLPLITIIEKIADRKLNRHKLELEVEKLELDVESARNRRKLALAEQPKLLEVIEEKPVIVVKEAETELDATRLERKKLQTQNLLIKRLDRSPIKLKDMSVTTMEGGEEKDEGK